MRPLYKDDPPQYPYYTDASLNTGLTFTQKQIIAAYGGVGSGGGPARTNSIQLTVRRIQDDLLKWLLHRADNVNHASPFKNIKPKSLQAAVARLRERIAEQYRPANRDLTEQLGDYCSFCEIPIPSSQLDVEHRVPKAPYPLWSVWWPNFLRCCTSCNSTKGEKPTRQDARGWTGVPNPTEAQLMAAAQGHYVWPDLDDRTYRKFSYGLKDVGANYAAIVQGSPFDDYFSHELNGEVYAHPAARRVEVTVVVATIDPKDAALWSLVGLDKRGRQSGDRARYRTLAWLEIVQAIWNMDQALRAIHNAQLKKTVFTAFWNTVLLLAKRVGFYSTVVTLLLRFDDLYTNEYQTLGDRFIADTDPRDPNNDPFVIIPGTRTTAVP